MCASESARFIFPILAMTGAERNSNSVGEGLGEIRKRKRRGYFSGVFLLGCCPRDIFAYLSCEKESSQILSYDTAIVLFPF